MVTVVLRCSGYPCPEGRGFTHLGISTSVILFLSFRARIDLASACPRRMRFTELLFQLCCRATAPSRRPEALRMGSFKIARSVKARLGVSPAR